MQTRTLFSPFSRTSKSAPFAPVYLAIFSISAATLALEIALTRIFAITQFYHFAFLAVSTVLLGFGASGTALSLWPARLGTSTFTGTPDHALRRLVERTAFLFCLCVVASFLLINTLPLDTYAIALDRRQWWVLICYYLALVAPFFLSGLSVATALSAMPAKANQVYAANLLGSAVGALGVPLVISWLGLVGTLFAISGLGAVAALLAARSRWARAISGLALLPLFVLAVYPPTSLELRLSPYKVLSQALLYPGARVLNRADGPIARVEILESGGIRSFPGLSFQYRGPLSPQYGLLVDSDNLNPVLDTRRSLDWSFLDYLPAAIAYRLAPSGPALVLQPGGGLPIWQALHPPGAATRPVTTIAPDPLPVALIDRWLGPASPYLQPQITVIHEPARSFLAESTQQRTPETFSLIHLPLAQGFRPVTSGAYSLSEDYDLTSEAMATYLAHLRPDGVLVMSRWLQTPPSESVRALALLVQGLRTLGVAEPRAHVVGFRGIQVATFLVKITPWRSSDLALVREFCRTNRFDLTLAPDLQPAEINRYNILPNPYYETTYQSLLQAGDLQAFYSDYAFAIAPPTDQHPFFFHFFKWGQTPAILQTLGQTWQPFGGSGFLILLALLILVVVVSAFLIVLPLVIGRFRQRMRIPFPPGAGRALAYFGLLGIGYLFVEIPLIQRFILFLGNPTYSLAAVLAALLCWSGIGSLFVRRMGSWLMVGLLVAVLLVYIVGLGPIFDIFLGLPAGSRLVVTLILLGPLGFLMGMPFPLGLQQLQRPAEAAAGSMDLVPWAWAVNGFASVFSSVLATLLALEWGFNLVLILGAFCYAAAVGILWRGRFAT